MMLKKNAMVPIPGSYTQHVALWSMEKFPYPSEKRFYIYIIPTTEFDLFNHKFVMSYMYSHPINDRFGI